MAAAYLVSHGCTAEVGHFQAADGIACRRGDRVVVRGQRGLELGEVMGPASMRFAGNAADSSAAGELVRLATAEDETIAAALRDRAEQLFGDGQRLATELSLPIEIMDVEIGLEGHQVTLYYVRWQECDERPLVRALSQKYESLVALCNVGSPAGAGGCGLDGCTHTDGGCSTCSTGGGCSTGCGKTMGKDVQEYFAGLRQKMEERRVSLV